MTAQTETATRRLTEDWPLMPTDRDEVLRRFRADTADFEMQVIADDGLRRELLFTSPRTNISSFRIVTWTHHLAITGDGASPLMFRVGSSSTPDPFTFFRTHSGAPNPGYWAEKILGTGARDGIHPYDGDAAAGIVAALVEELIDEQLDPDSDAAERLRCAVEVDVLDYRYVEHEFREALASFEIDLPELDHRFEIADAWHLTLTVPDYRWLWTCEAIVHAIATYDATQSSAAA